MALVVAEDAERRIGEPDRAVGLDDDVVRRVEPLALEACRISTVIVPSYSVRVTRRASCSQVTSRPCRSRVLPLALFDGLRNTLTAPVSSSQRMMRLLGMSLHSRQRASPNHTGPSPQRMPVASRSTLGERQAVFVEARIEDLDRRIGIAQARLPAAGRGASRHRDQSSGDIREVSLADYHRGLARRSGRFARRCGRGPVAASACATTLRIRLGSASPASSASATQRMPAGARVRAGTGAR